MKSDAYTRCHYDAERESIERLVRAATAVSQAIGGVKTSTRYIRATQLFTRLSVGAYTFVRLLPGNSLTRDHIEFWDWPSIACIARNLVETYHAFFYLVDPSLAEDECEMRIALMHLHMNSEKYRLYKEWKPDADILKSFEEGIPKDRERLEQNTAFMTLGDGRRAELLKGRSAMHLSNADIGESLPFIDRHFRPLYRLFSAHVHSTPLSFQSQSNERGRGDENDAERFYVVLAIHVVQKYLSAAILDISRIFTERVATTCPDATEVAQEFQSS